MNEKINNMLKDISNDISNLINYNKDDITTLLKEAIYSYYNTDKPILSNELYDIIIDEYKKYNDINLLGFVNKNNKHKLDYWMGSINKIKNNNNLEIWKKKFNNKCIVADKLDGVSSLLIYTYTDIKLYTRGDGTYGTNISHLLDYIKKIPSMDEINHYLNKYNTKGTKNKFALRGELMIKKEVFKKKWSKQFKNSRNMISGIVNSKDINIDLCKDIELVLYEIIDPIFNFEKQLNILNKINFILVYYEIVDDINKLTENFLTNYLQVRKKKSLYEIDGIVITTLNDYIRNTSGNPEYSIAYKKIDTEGIKTKVIDVKWNISKDGFLIPVIYIEPININNAIIKKTLGFNAKYIVDNNIGINTQVEIIRSGDVIPYITKVYINKKIKPLLPPNDIDWKWYNDIDIILKNNDTNKDYQLKNIFHFFNKLKTKGLGIKNLEKIYNKGFDTIIKILTITKKDLLSIDTFEEKTSNNILNEISKLRKGVNILDLVIASNKLNHGIGKERIKLIFEMDSHIITKFNKNGTDYYYNNIIKLPGFNHKTTKLFIDSFNDFIQFHDTILNYINIIYITDDTIKNNTKDKNIKNNNIENKIFVFSGFREQSLEDKIKSCGGIVKLTYVKNLDYLVIEDENLLKNPTSKIIKALNDKKNIITINDINKLLLK